MIQTAKLTERLELQELTLSGNSFGATVETWKTVKTIYGSITRQAGALKDQDGNQYLDRISFFCRYLNIDKKGFRIKYQGNPYKIENVTVIQRNQNVIIDCSVAV